jgi:hypothetical protein
MKNVNYDRQLIYNHSDHYSLDSLFNHGNRVTKQELLDGIANLLPDGDGYVFEIDDSCHDYCYEQCYCVPRIRALKGHYETDKQLAARIVREERAELERLDRRRREREEQKRLRALYGAEDQVRAEMKAKGLKYRPKWAPEEIEPPKELQEKAGFFIQAYPKGKGF